MRKFLTKLYIRWNEPKWMLYFFSPSPSIMWSERSKEAFEGKTMYEVLMENYEKGREEDGKSEEVM